MWKTYESTDGGGRLTAKCLYEELFFPPGSRDIPKPMSGRCERVMRIGDGVWVGSGQTTDQRVPSTFPTLELNNQDVLIPNMEL